MKQSIIALGIAATVVPYGAQTHPVEKQSSQTKSFVCASTQTEGAPSCISISTQTELNPNAKPYVPPSILPEPESLLSVPVTPAAAAPASRRFNPQATPFSPSQISQSPQVYPYPLAVPAEYLLPTPVIDRSNAKLILTPKQFTPLPLANKHMDAYLRQFGAHFTSLIEEQEGDIPFWNTLEFWNNIRKGMDENGRSATFVCDQFVSGLECYIEILNIAMRDPEKHMDHLKHAFFETGRMLPYDFLIEVHGVTYGKLDFFNKFIETIAQQHFDLFQARTPELFKVLKKSESGSIQLEFKNLESFHTFIDSYKDLLINECDFLNNERINTLLQKRHLICFNFDVHLNAPDFLKPANTDSPIDMKTVIRGSQDTGTIMSIVSLINKNSNNPFYWDALGQVMVSLKRSAPPRKFYFRNELYTETRCFINAFLLRPTQERFLEAISLKLFCRTPDKFFFNTGSAQNFNVKSIFRCYDGSSSPVQSTESSAPRSPVESAASSASRSPVESAASSASRSSVESTTEKLSSQDQEELEEIVKTIIEDDED